MNDIIIGEVESKPVCKSIPNQILEPLPYDRRLKNPAVCLHLVKMGCFNALLQVLSL